ncbi:hypothetical protein IMG5_193160 [Ichthyophthirius multifiliis]|uniref:Uncharacterized protein n=1 Tax=Ichthyophthirius multifiliis TaxID=5932 RepID=G0R4I9_ICHMU|nr:hypothetical protein IMG5_193160 [Ichthyophthirius multifiliis]EGR27617.1 hypothetical protein IMG5_193160 [Ichthyophthirius multifiliis]|eukprot:XP_004025069.1 hypothetical protein IMG5_193160 [Ichthyophthirius multifiliis]
MQPKKVKGILQVFFNMDIKVFHAFIYKTLRIILNRMQQIQLQDNILKKMSSMKIQKMNLLKNKNNFAIFLSFNYWFQPGICKEMNLVKNVLKIFQILKNKQIFQLLVFKKLSLKIQKIMNLKLKKQYYLFRDFQIIIPQFHIRIYLEI